MKVLKQVLAASLALALGGVSIATQAGIINVFDGVGSGQLRADWVDQVGAFTEEDFAGGVLDDFSISTPGKHHNGFDTTDQLTDRLKTGKNSVSSTTITFNFEIFAFGANWDLRFRGAGRGIQMNVGGFLIPIEIPDTHAGEFFGFISDVGFKEIVLFDGTQRGGPEKYTADNFVYTSYSPRLDPAPQIVPVPEPGTLALLVLGVLGIGFWRRKA